MKDKLLRSLSGVPTLPETWQVQLSTNADRELRGFCVQHHIRPEYVLAYFCESFLNDDHLRDRLNAEGAVQTARWQERANARRERRQRKEAA